MYSGRKVQQANQCNNLRSCAVLVNQELLLAKIATQKQGGKSKTKTLKHVKPN